MKNTDNSPKYPFESKRFIQHNFVFLFLVMLPSFMLDLFFIYTLTTGSTFFLLPKQIHGIGDVLSPFVANFLMFKAPAILYYLKIKTVWQQSYILILDNQVLFRKYLRAPFSNINYGYTYYEDTFFINPTNVQLKKNGAIVVFGQIPVQKKMRGSNAIVSQRIAQMVVIPPYFSNVDELTKKLKSLVVRT